MSNLSLQTNSSVGKENCLKFLTLLNEKVNNEDMELI